MEEVSHRLHLCLIMLCGRGSQRPDQERIRGANADSLLHGEGRKQGFILFSLMFFRS